MPSPEPDPRPHSYAQLRAVKDAAGDGSGASAAPPNPYWQQQAERLDAMLQSLWDGYTDAPANGLPNDLVQLVGTYTSAMRLKLTLMGYSSTQRRSFKPATPPQPNKAKTP